MPQQIFPVILSGGSGSRLWPTSRELYPKQLLPLTAERSLLQQTADRLIDGQDLRPDFEPPVVICNHEHRFVVASQLGEMGLQPSAQVLEPAGRNTAPAATLAALVVSELQGDGLILLMPADHHIDDLEVFHTTVLRGAVQAEKGALVTFGISPTSPETGYGYIEQGVQMEADPHAFQVAKFEEKPDLVTAKKYLQSGKHFWNAGIFMFRADVFLDEVKTLAPEILTCCRDALQQGHRDLDFRRLDDKVFRNCPSTSIDYAIMEKTQKCVVVPTAMGWSDVGSWSSLWTLGNKDQDGNVQLGDVISVDTTNSYIRGQDRLIATLGVDNLIVIETADAVLVAARDEVQQIKKIVEHLQAQGRTEHEAHVRVYRPWGYYESVQSGERHQVKHLMVNPGASLSLQMHHHRSEHWVVVKGTARVVVGDKEVILTENQSTFIPLGVKHRLENPGKLPLDIIEVQSGSYLGEDDIVRFQDVYDRVDEN